VKKRLMEIIKAKIAGESVTIAPPEEPKGEVIDLMEALKASLAKSAKAAPAEEAPKAGRKGARAEADAEEKGKVTRAAGRRKAG